MIQRIEERLYPPPELVELYRRTGVTSEMAETRARQVWRRIGRLEAFRELQSDLYEEVKRVASIARGEVSVLAQWNKMVFDYMMVADDERSIVHMFEMLRRANGHDSSTVKHERKLPDEATMQKWKQEMIDAGILDLERVSDTPLKLIEGRVVDRGADQQNGSVA